MSIQMSRKFIWGSKRHPLYKSQEKFCHGGLKEAKPPFRHIRQVKNCAQVWDLAKKTNMGTPPPRACVRARILDKKRELSTSKPQRWDAGKVDKIKSRQVPTTTQAKRWDDAPRFLSTFQKRPQPRRNRAFFADDKKFSR